jgi:hypothetical protein
MDTLCIVILLQVIFNLLSSGYTALCSENLPLFVLWHYWVIVCIMNVDNSFLQMFPVFRKNACFFCLLGQSFMCIYIISGVCNLLNLNNQGNRILAEHCWGLRRSLYIRERDKLSTSLTYVHIHQHKIYKASWIIIPRILICYL